MEIVSLPTQRSLLPVCIVTALVPDLLSPCNSLIISVNQSFIAHCFYWQCGALLDESQKLDFTEEIQEEYEEIREEHYDSLKVSDYIPCLSMDWGKIHVSAYFHYFPYPVVIFFQICSMI